MCICEYCYQELLSRGEKLKAVIEWVDENDYAESLCDWCSNSGNDKLYNIEFKECKK